MKFRTEYGRFKNTVFLSKMQKMQVVHGIGIIVSSKLSIFVSYNKVHDNERND